MPRRPEPLPLFLKNPSIGKASKTRQLESRSTSVAENVHELLCYQFLRSTVRCGSLVSKPFVPVVQSFPGVRMLCIHVRQCTIDYNKRCSVDVRANAKLVAAGCNPRRGYAAGEEVCVREMILNLYCCCTRV